ncbi:hypothetical protein A2833_00740 [Candidatus Azambacteria bacterium RIFCSPHIGHO2_01_FULL_44_55]|uniref:Uncharacterized protein n=1 Tax=Candidatus Azambacteria bacterium RIFCSPLOWO2_02_FULL_44_14 TaxID=1797306 RepID=A0A1F5CCZ5_9BACT|nr:MAG: hypothetical protein A3A18_00360 [Candidatus Azambacteria bacterium RIFCSPLOWO2_01_FULL_44_84]OGD33285.1 MAG: hypothetical protein A3C78_01720 [Candidatus Azambacteria bacterium RIFCSPHIGHO2_02_FULL_45_18]OGD40731.1 MAG: hypothetical protein A3I30_00110 [Candidatus Azambacteria bacterium RIFCSPLOWO2_02_FULL_44_14]OGD40831.1 MAG: hypothetical protein A2833_00740 [Candidatus Azambacteria bacterium RIFCSPHIGHO2_01_FULL_44_55]OGD51544.1 MAG: hypothetical protein A2608_01250 [Candidatus Azam
MAELRIRNSKKFVIDRREEIENMTNQSNQPAAPATLVPQSEEEKKKKALESIGKVYGKSAEEEQKKEKYMKGLFGGEVPGMAERRKKLTQERGPQT